ncbi:MAG: VWA domain-containing protein, partial [Candidatus Sulfotelmatobacter sp.]
MRISFAQKSQGAPSTDVETFRSSTRLVVLDVVVTDKAGNPVRNLIKDDFTIVEDGVPQSLATFETPEPDSSASPRMAKDKNKGNEKDGDTPGMSSARATRAMNIIVLDELNSEFLDQAHARVAIDKFLRSEGPRLSSPTALLILGQKQLEVLHDYTQDSGALLEALKRRHAEMPSALMSSELYSSGDRLAMALQSLNLIADANRHFAARKNVIWVGPGFPALNSNAYLDRGILGGDVQSVGNLLLDARMVVYTLDPRGIEAQPASYRKGDSGDPLESELTFEQVAPETGGRIFRIRNDIDVAIADSIKDGSYYYT